MPKRRAHFNVGGKGKKTRTSPSEQALSSLVSLVTQEVLAVLDKQNAKPEFSCWNCEEIGHMARDCPNDVRCFRCDGWGHKAYQCATPEPSSTYDLRERLNARANLDQSAKYEQGGEGSGAAATAARVAVTSSSSSSSSLDEGDTEQAQTPDPEAVLAVAEKLKRAPLATMEGLDD
jgi:hypothetical protein